ncbi:hypothetical protein QVA66_10150 [Staphylococcus chromogenes]|nr:hypothetical protein [Staphylococcus chromogenes]
MPSSNRLPWAISEVCAPWISNIVLFLALGIHCHQVGVGTLCALFTSILPMAWILALKHQGRVNSHHVTERSQRGLIFAGIAILLATLIGLLLRLGADPLIWRAVCAALGFITLFALVTGALKFKISVHVGLWLTVMGYLAIVVHPAWWALFFLAPAVAWARVQVSHHTWRETAGGAIAGLLVLGCALL